MVRLLSTCVVLVLVATLILDCEALFRRLRPNQLCCVRRRCTVGNRRVKCCGRRRVCTGKRGFNKGFCRRRCLKRGRDVEEPEEEEAEALDTLTADP
ncbi:hypothetical protein ACOMHN_052096 [Nucella lapillus]